MTVQSDSCVYYAKQMFRGEVEVDPAVFVGWTARQMRDQRVSVPDDVPDDSVLQANGKAFLFFSWIELDLVLEA